MPIEGIATDKPGADKTIRITARGVGNGRRP